LRRTPILLKKRTRGSHLHPGKGEKESYPSILGAKPARPAPQPSYLVAEEITLSPGLRVRDGGKPSLGERVKTRGPSRKRDEAQEGSKVGRAVKLTRQTPEAGGERKELFGRLRKKYFIHSCKLDFHKDGKCSSKRQSTKRKRKRRDVGGVRVSSGQRT